MDNHSERDCVNERAIMHPGPLESEVQDKRIRAVLILVESEPAYSVCELAQQVHLSSSQLGRLFRQQMGTQIGDWLLEQRLQRAAHLLSTTSLSIKEIAYAVGYEHPPSFTRAFDRRFAQSPKGYRKQGEVHAEPPEGANMTVIRQRRMLRKAVFG